MKSRSLTRTRKRSRRVKVKPLRSYRRLIQKSTLPKRKRVVINEDANQTLIFKS